MSDPVRPPAECDAPPARSAERRALLAGLGGLAAGAMLSRPAHAGPLDPPAGPVASTGKTLHQVEPRTPINTQTVPGDADSSFKITQPGSYYFTGGVGGREARHGIKIAASGVTIDMMGFTLQGVTGSLDGIMTEGIRSNITIRNGIVRSWGGDGIDLTHGGIGSGSLIECAHAADNGARGIRTGLNAVVRACTASSNHSQGISTSSCASIAQCAAYLNQDAGILAGTCASIVNCSSRYNYVAGISAGHESVITNCATNGNDGVGIWTFDASVIAACTASGNLAGGITLTSDCLVRDNVVDGNAGVGINATSSQNRIEQNNCTGNTTGIRVSAARNVIVRNTCSGNSTNWDLAANNVYGPIIDRRAPASNAVTGNAGPGSLGTPEPNANFSY